MRLNRGDFDPLKHLGSRRNLMDFQRQHRIIIPMEDADSLYRIHVGRYARIFWILFKSIEIKLILDLIRRLFGCLLFELDLYYNIVLVQ